MTTLVECFRVLQFKPKERIADLIVPRFGMRTARICDAEFQLDLSDFIQRRIYSGSFERLQSKIVRSHLRPGMTCFDVGANVGYYTALFAQAVGSGGRVFSFEPSDYAFPRLQAMIERNRLTWVRPVKLAVTDSIGQGVLYGGVQEDALGNHTATMVKNSNPAQTIVETTTLDVFCDQFGIERIDFLKVDVDGFEPAVIAGAQSLLNQGRISHVLIECNEEWLGQVGTNSTNVIEELRKHGMTRARRIGRSEDFLVSRD